MASGAMLPEFDIADVEGRSARAFKSMLAAKLGIPEVQTFRFFSEEDSQQIEVMRCFFWADSMKLKVLRFFEFCPLDCHEDEKMNEACRRNDSVALEKLLQKDGSAPLRLAERATGWWFGTFLFSYILGIIIPTDYYFSEGLKPPTS